MGVSTTHTAVTYNGNGVTSVFPVTMQFFRHSHLEVVLVGTSGDETAWSLGVQYTVIGGAQDGDGNPTTIPDLGNVVVEPAYIPILGQSLRIVRRTPLLQETVHSNNDAFPAKSVEGAYDYLTLLSQEALYSAEQEAARAAAFAAECEASAAQALASEVVAASASGSAIDAAAAALASAAVAAGAALSAISAAEASGPINFYDTKAAANAALAGLSNGSIVEVMIDESRSYWRTRYVKTAGVYVFKMRLPSAPIVAVDSVDGNDANDGLNIDAPKKTLAAAIALCTPGCRLLIRAGSRFDCTDRLDFTGNVKAGMSIEAYDAGPKPILSADKLISTAWTQDATYPNVWYQDITHINTVTASSSLAANSPWFRLFDERDYTLAPDAFYHTSALTSYFAGADIAANRAYVDANAGTFTCHRTGSTTKDPRTHNGTATQFRYYLHLVDGANPNTSGVSIYYAEQVLVAYLISVERVAGLEFRRSMTKDLMTIRRVNFENCEFNDCAMHGGVGSEVTYRKCRKTALESSKLIATGLGGGYHMFRDDTLDGTSRGCFVEDCEAVGFGIGFYSHGVGASPQHQTVNASRITARSCTVGWYGVYSKRAVFIRGFKAVDCKTFVAPQGKTQIENFIFTQVSDGPSPNYVLNCFDNLGLKNGLIYMSPSLTANNNYIFNGNGGGYQVDCDTVIIMNAVQGTVLQSSSQSNIKLKLRNSVFHMVRQEKYPCLHLDAANSIVAIGRYPLEQLQADFVGVGDNIAGTVLTPCQLQTFEYTVQAGDISWFSPSKAVNLTNGSTTVSPTSAQDFAVAGSYIKVLDFDGAGNDYLARVASLSGNNLIVDVAPTANGSAKTIQIGYFNKQIFPISAGTFKIETGGINFIASEPRHFKAGTYVYVGALGKEEDYGIRKIATYDITTGIGTLDRAVNWQRFPAGGAIWASTTVTAVRVALPAHPVSFAQPIMGPMTIAGVVYPRWKITLPDTSTIESDSNASFHAFNGQGRKLNADGANSGTYTQWESHPGYINAGFNPVKAGDVLQVIAPIYIENLLPKFNSDPLSSGRVDISRNSDLNKIAVGVLDATLWPLAA